MSGKVKRVKVFWEKKGVFWGVWGFFFHKASIIMFTGVFGLGVFGVLSQHTFRLHDRFISNPKEEKKKRKEKRKRNEEKRKKEKKRKKKKKKRKKERKKSHHKA